MMKPGLLIVLVLGLAYATRAHEAPCHDEAFRQFDFWLGTWRVSPADDPDTLAGYNRIEAIDGGCALLERWTSANRITGTSLNIYNPVTRQWRQLWVSAQEYSIDIRGGWMDGAMRMDGEITYYNGVLLPFRGVWTPLEDGSVRQTFHQKEGEEWVSWFDGIYTRQN